MGKLPYGFFESPVLLISYQAQHTVRIPAVPLGGEHCLGPEVFCRDWFRGWPCARPFNLYTASVFAGVQPDMVPHRFVGQCLVA